MISLQPTIFRSIAGAFLAFAALASANAPPEAFTFSRPMAVLDLADLRDNHSRSAESEALGRNLAREGFRVIPHDSMERALAESGTWPRPPCDNTQCAFDAGGYLHADFVLYGTYASIEKVETVTLKLLYVPTARIAWTWVGELPDKEEKNPSASLADAAAAGRLDLRPRHDEPRELAVLDVSENMYPARVMLERVQTHANALERYQPLASSELSDLLSALGINKYALGPSPQNMVGLGERLGVASLIYVRVYREGNNYLCRLAMYDVQANAVVADVPPRPYRDFSGLLDYEKDFFSLVRAQEAKNGGGREGLSASGAEADSGGRGPALWVSLAALGLVGSAALLWVVSQKK